MRCASPSGANFGEFTFRNCLENSRRCLEHSSLTPLGRFVAPIRDQFRISKQFLTLSLLGVERDITRKGGRADERASPTGKAQEYPTVGTRALLQQRDYVGDPRLLR